MLHKAVEEAIILYASISDKLNEAIQEMFVYKVLCSNVCFINDIKEKNIYSPYRTHVLIYCMGFASIKASVCYDDSEQFSLVDVFFSLLDQINICKLPCDAIGLINPMVQLIFYFLEWYS